MVGANLSLAVTGTMGPRTEQARAIGALRTGGSALGEVSSLSPLVFLPFADGAGSMAGASGQGKSGMLVQPSSLHSR